MSCGQILREEFRLKNFGFGRVHPECFYSFLCRPPPILYLIYRMTMAAYTLAMLIITASHNSTVTTGIPWSAFLTNWTYVALTIHMIFHLILTMLTFCLRASRGGSLIKRTNKAVHHDSLQQQAIQDGYQNIDTRDQSNDVSVISTRLSIFHAILWISYNYVSSAALMVTIIFWSVIAPGIGGDASNMDNIQLHIVNSVIVLLEHCLSIIPIRLLHFIYPIIYGLIYVIFTAIYYWVGGNNPVIYSILDWGKPGMAVGYIFLIALVVFPLIQFLLFGIYQLKVFIYQRYNQHH